MSNVRASMLVGAEIQQLATDEGFRAEPYIDTEGYLTVGFGTCIAQTGPIPFDPVLKISEETGMYLMRNKLFSLLKEMESSWWWFETAPMGAQTVLLNMAYNLGVPRLKGFKKTLGFISRGEYAKAADEMLINSAGDGPSEWYTEVGARAKRLSERLRALQ